MKKDLVSTEKQANPFGDKSKNKETSQNRSKEAPENKDVRK